MQQDNIRPYSHRQIHRCLLPRHPPRPLPWPAGREGRCHSSLSHLLLGLPLRRFRRLFLRCLPALPPAATQAEALCRFRAPAPGYPAPTDPSFARTCPREAASECSSGPAACCPRAPVASQPLCSTHGTGSHNCTGTSAHPLDAVIEFDTASRRIVQ